MIQLNLEFFPTVLLFVLPFLFLFIKAFSTANKKSSASSQNNKLPRVYPIVGSSFTIAKNHERFSQWATELLQNSPNGNILLYRPLGHSQLITTNPSNVEHILKTQFYKYPKGEFFRDTLLDFLGDGIFNADADTWKFQRQMSSHEFSTRSLRKFIETVVEDELSGRLLPLLSSASANNTVFDLQDILQRFAFDNICKIAFGFDPECLSPSFPQPVSEFAEAFEDATNLSSARFNSIFPPLWKLKRALNIGSERRLREAISTVKEYATNLVRKKKKELELETLQSEDLLSKFLSSGHSDERFVTDIVISFIVAGRDTTSAALTWFFWLVSNNLRVEEEILKEIKEKPEALDYDEVKHVVYIHASLCESMRLYPPVPIDTKFSTEEDVLPDGTFVKKGVIVTYIPYAMGRTEAIWGKDWPEFRPERWLEKDEAASGKWKFVGKDSYSYPVFQAGPRVCLGKEMAFLQMQRLVAEIMRRYRVVTAEKDFDPFFTSYLSAKMKGGFPVRVERRD
ncbi:cytochrome P450 94A2-like [Macadamia integrifolia]|uniref:cytochrome P450 94A2-like n=1 Tax=Macadamia integrifolia TaxID=60698 RepID=UPI001C4FAF57|nr:cytochrome P450 94A2-like [Macadamia integrifolia]